MPEELQAEMLETTGEDFQIYPNNVLVWQAFLAISTQIRTCPSFGVLGFDFCGVKAGLKMAEIKCTVDIFSKLKIIEAEMVKQLNKRPE